MSNCGSLLRLLINIKSKQTLRRATHKTCLPTLLLNGSVVWKSNLKRWIQSNDSSLHDPTETIREVKPYSNCTMDFDERL
jgi:hypothetical protein